MTEPHWGQSDDTPAIFRRGDGGAPASPSPAPPAEGQDQGASGGWTPEWIDSFVGRIDRIAKEWFFMWDQHRKGGTSEKLKTEFVDGETTSTADAGNEKSGPRPGPDWPKKIYDGVLDLMGEIPHPELVSVQYVINMMIEKEADVKDGIAKWLAE